MRKLYLFLKAHPVGVQLTFSHCRLLFPFEDINKINYYIGQVQIRNLSKRQLQDILKNKGYERLPKDTKNKLGLIKG